MCLTHYENTIYKNYCLKVPFARFLSRCYIEGSFFKVPAQIVKVSFFKVQLGRLRVKNPFFKVPSQCSFVEVIGLGSLCKMLFQYQVSSDKFGCCNFHGIVQQNCRSGCYKYIK